MKRAAAKKIQHTRIDRLSKTKVHFHMVGDPPWKSENERVKILYDHAMSQKRTVATNQRDLTA